MAEYTIPTHASLALRLFWETADTGQALKTEWKLAFLKEICTYKENLHCKGVSFSVLYLDKMFDSKAWKTLINGEDTYP